MAVRVGSSFSCLLSAALFSPSQTRSPFKVFSSTTLELLRQLYSDCYYDLQWLGDAQRLSLSRGSYNNQQHETRLRRHARDKSCIHGILYSRVKSLKWHGALFAVSEDQSLDDEIRLVASDQENNYPSTEDIPTASSSNFHLDGAGGKPGLISFYNRPYKIEDEARIASPERNLNNLLWFVGPAVLVASFVFPSLYLRRVLLAVFEDSLLTDFLILFFTEALFYCGVAVFLLLIDHLRRPTVLDSAVNTNDSPTPQLGQRISSVAALVLSLIIPMVTMGLVWPWTGPAASATLAPYLVGIVVQFAFEQYARHTKSPSWPVIPIIFQVYRLHQLNRAAQLVTALSFTVRGAEMTSHNLAINSSLGTLLNVLQCLGVICIWSLSSFLMRFFPSNSVSAQ